MARAEARWSLRPPGGSFPYDGQFLRIYVNGWFIHLFALNTEETIKQFEAPEGELTAKISSKSEAEESEPDSETIQLGTGSYAGPDLASGDPSINASIPNPTGLTLQEGWTEDA
jgi:hypothetical protein